MQISAPHDQATRCLASLFSNATAGLLIQNSLERWRNKVAPDQPAPCSCNPPRQILRYTALQAPCLSGGTVCLPCGTKLLAMDVDRACARHRQASCSAPRAPQFGSQRHIDVHLPFRLSYAQSTVIPASSAMTPHLRCVYTELCTRVTTMQWCRQESRADC